MSWTIRTFRPTDTDAVIALWDAAGLLRPWNDPRRDIERKLTVHPELFLVAEDEGTEASDDGEADSPVIGTVMGGYDGHRGWLYYLATATTHRRRGVARALVQESERRLTEMGCPKVQLMVREGNEGVLGFYDSIGYERFSVSQTGKRLIADA